MLEIPGWPATLRLAGQYANVIPNGHIGDLLLMGLLGVDPATYELVPALASHWQESEDRSTYRFRINPEARWSDGRPVVAADVVATWRLRTDPGLLSPSSVLTFGKFEAPKALSLYIVEVRAKEPHWANLLYFGTMGIFPAHEVGALTGAAFLERYQFAYPASTGPYVVKPDDVVAGQRVTLTRRRDWWAEDNPVYDGKYNLGSIRYEVVRDANLAFEKLSGGEIDLFAVPNASWYAVDLPRLDAVRRGLLVRRKFYTSSPRGLSGLALNLRRPPLDDVRVRKALQLLTDRETMIAQLFYGEYVPTQSYFAGGIYENPDNPPIGYDEAAAVDLLEQAGFTEISADGIRTRDGVPLSLAVTYSSEIHERALTTFQEAARRAGIRIALNRQSFATAHQTTLQRRFDLSMVSFGGRTIPNPETQWHSSLADQVDNNNVTAYANPRVDALCEAYARTFDPQERVRIVRAIDAILYQDHPYVLWWDAPAARVVMWDKFGLPEPWGVGAYATDQHSALHLTDYWWFDAEKAARIEAARSDPTMQLDPGPEHWRFWDRRAGRAAWATPAGP